MKEPEPPQITSSEGVVEDEAVSAADVDIALPGWLPMPQPRQVLGHSFVSGEQSLRRMRVQYFLRAADQVVVGKAWFGPDAQGPPGHVHGGALASLLDEAMGVAAWAAGFPSVAAKINVDFRRAVPLSSLLLLTATVSGAKGRRIHTAAELAFLSGKVCARAEGMFVRVAMDVARDQP